MKFHNDGIACVCVLDRETTHWALVSTLTGANSSSEAVYQQSRADRGIYGLWPLSIIELVLNKEQTDGEDPRLRCPLQHFYQLYWLKDKEDGSEEPSRGIRLLVLCGTQWQLIRFLFKTHFCRLYKNKDIERKALRMIGENEERKTGKVNHKKEGRQGKENTSKANVRKLRKIKAGTVE